MDKKPHILLVCDANSFWMKEYIINILDSEKYNITILSSSNTIFKNSYKENNINVIASNIHNPQHKLPGNFKNNVFDLCGSIKRGIKKILPTSIVKYIHQQTFSRKIKNILANVQDIDIIHYFYIPNNLEYDYYPFLKNFPGRLIFTYVGSDLLRQLPTRNDNKNLLKKCTYITCESLQLYKKFHEIYGSEFDDKLKMIHFGVTAYDTLNELPPADYKATFGFPDDKINIMLGSNATPAQQHLKLLEGISSLPSSIKSKIHICIPWTYGVQPGEEPYYEQVREIVKTADFSAEILEDFLDNTRLAAFRKAVDIFVHGQTTDSFSSTMLEILYAGGLVLNASWLPYEELKRLGIYSLNFQDFTDLPTQLTSIINQIDVHKDAAKTNRHVLFAYNSWRAVAEKWRELYSC